MLISKTLLLMASSLALTTPTLAQDQATAFEYSPVVRLTRSGQFQAEVWRRDVRTDHSGSAWSNGENYPTAAAAMIEACASLRKNFDVTFSCSRAAPQGVAGAAATLSDTAGAMKSAVPAVERNGTLMKRPVGPERVTSDASGAWLKDFWKNQERQSGGGSGGGGEGGGGGGGGGVEVGTEVVRARHGLRTRPGLALPEGVWATASKLSFRCWEGTPLAERSRT